MFENAADSVEQIERLFHDALERPELDRDTFLRSSCRNNTVLYEEVRSLLMASEQTESLLPEYALDLGLRVLAHNSSQRIHKGKKIGPYEVKSLLGKGGMGEIYLAIDTRLNRKVALKFLSSEMATDDSAKQQLLREARAAALLDHANICQIYSIEDHEDATFIVMQYIEGITLSDLLRKGPIRRELLRSLIKQIVSALAHAHSHGIIHRDIKPQNIMVTQYGQAKILDFGLAISLKKTHEEAPGDVELRPGVVPGTIRYMSPEQLLGTNLDFRSDVFSLGTLLYEMVCGTHPFSRKRNVDTIEAIRSAVPPPLRGGLRQRQIGTVVLRCLSKNPNDRYFSANEILTDLDRRLAQRIAPSLAF